MQKYIISMLITLFFGLLIQVEIAQGGPIEDLKPGEWYECPNSKINAVLPDPIPPGSYGPKSITHAWNSAAYDTKRDRYIITGGGHNDYGGNEIYAFDMNTLKWSRIWGPSPDIPPIQGPCNETYSDGNPRSRHTYDGLEYLPNVDKFWVHGGSLYCGGGAASLGTWTFDFDTLEWSRAANGYQTRELEEVSAYDPVTGKVYAAGPASAQKLSEYDPVADGWTMRGDSSINYGQSAVIDPVRRKFISMGRGTVLYFTLNPSGNLTRQTLNTTGATDIVNSRYPGIAYDSASDRLVAWKGGTDVYVLDLDTRVWTRVPPAPTNKVVPTSPPSQGTYGKWQYVPSKDVFIVVNSISENVYVYRLSTSTTPATDTEAPSTPVNLTATATSASQIELTWDASTDNVGVAGYKIYRDGTQVASTGTTSHPDIGLSPSSTYTYTVTAYDSSGNTSTQSLSASATTEPTSVTPPPSTVIDIPPQTWVARRLPEKVPCARDVCKHIRLAHNPDNGSIYFSGGDYTGTSITSRQSGRNELFSYSVADDTWVLEYPYCGPLGEVQPAGPDEVGLVFDTKRHIFWMAPGYMWGDQGICQGSSASQIKNELMTFDPLTRTWTDPPRNNLCKTLGVCSEDTKFAQYDPVEDTIIQFYWTGSAPAAAIYDIQSDSWTKKSFSGNARFGMEYTAMDLDNRHIYICSPYEDKLYRYNMDVRTLTDLGPLPAPTSADLSMLVWDSVNKLLMFPQFAGGQIAETQLYVYHPDTEQWETMPMNKPDGISVYGRHAVFDPIQNVLLVMGRKDGSDPRVFLYRYGGGSDTPPPGGNAPATPTNFRIIQ